MEERFVMIQEVIKLQSARQHSTRNIVTLTSAHPPIH